MNDLSFEFNSPMTKEDWEKLADNEMEDTEIVTFNTPSGKRVPYRKVKHGEWLGGDEYQITGICSVCGFESFLYVNDVAGMNFCPNCGADMRERKDSE